jgi:hypothetical protein
MYYYFSNERKFLKKNIPIDGEKYTLDIVLQSILKILLTYHVYLGTCAYGQLKLPLRTNGQNRNKLPMLF